MKSEKKPQAEFFAPAPAPIPSFYLSMALQKAPTSSNASLHCAYKTA